ncbi:zinc metallochaperone AztD [Nocardia concava]|uniref:zinc metallochaperone AztD n=1 Tax=Nocardia concava TaxID=257281 RepID=UPI0002F58F87|nr:zinc metallochaperone AztD [Nocardia concava]
MRIHGRGGMALCGAGAIVMVLSGCGSGESGTSKGPAIADPIAVTYDGGILLLDGNTLAQGGEVKLDGFNRLNPAGDDRHVMVSTKTGFRVLDAARAEFTDIEFPAVKPGHVVRHAGRTVLFDDGTGEVTGFDPARLDAGKPETRVYRTPEPHHGVAVELSNANLLVTLGTEEKRSGIAVLDKDRKEIARNENCPGVHGESIAADEAVAFGCEDGVLIYRDGVITKVQSPTPYGRIGNQAGSAHSPIVLGDYKQDEHAELERPRQISLIDTRTGGLRLVDLRASYTFRSLGRGPQGQALVLGTDGGLRVIDPEAGTVLRTIAVTGRWEEPLQWQRPRPALFVRGGDAYVSDPATNRLHRIDLAAGTIAATVTLPGTPNELSGVVAH